MKTRSEDQTIFSDYSSESSLDANGMENLKSSSPAGSGSYEELSPQEFDRRRDLVVLVVKAPHDHETFQEHRSIIPISSTSKIPKILTRLGKNQPLGVVCPFGDCSGRLAIRLSKLGYKVFHLGGGLLEWRHCFRKTTGSSCC